MFDGRAAYAHALLWVYTDDVRHAEKADDGTRNPPLNDPVEKRAAQFAELLSNQKVNALYSTPFKRTMQTLQPLADIHGLTIANYDPFAGPEWLSELIKKHAGETIVISGHSNTIPSMANALLGKEQFQQFDDSDYTNILMIVTDTLGQGNLTLVIMR